jgi:hypothetical protein
VEIIRGQGESVRRIFIRRPDFKIDFPKAAHSDESGRWIHISSATPELM